MYKTILLLFGLLVSLASSSVSFRSSPLPPLDSQNVDYTTFTVCHKLSVYEDQSWFRQADIKFHNEFLTPQGVSGHLSMSSDFAEGCLSDDQSLFVFIPEFYEFGCGKIFSYDINHDVLKTPPSNNGSPVYCASEFGENFENNYIPFKGQQGDGEACYQYTGKYDFIRNEVEVIKKSC